MTKLILNRYYIWECEKCKFAMALPGASADIETLKNRGWKYCPRCGEKLEYPREDNE